MEEAESIDDFTRSSEEDWMWNDAIESKFGIDASVINLPISFPSSNS